MLKLFKQEQILYVSLFLVIFLTSSFAVINDKTSGLTNAVLWIVVMVSSYVINNKYDVKYLIFILLYFLLFGITSFIHDEDVRASILVSVTHFSVFLLVNACTFNSFCKIYKDIIVAICLISLFCWLMEMVFPGIFAPFATVGISGMPCWNLFIYASDQMSIRNSGLFWEPGAFQVFINLALLMEICQKKYDNKKVLLYVVTIITTFSTTGFIGMTMCFLLSLIMKNPSGDLKLKLYIIAFAFLFLSVILFFPDLFFDRGGNTPFGKLIVFFDDYNRSSGALNTSTSTIRYYSIVKPIELFGEHPFWGVGKANLSKELFLYTMGMNTFTTINFFAFHGLLYGLIMLVGLFKFAKKIVDNKAIALFILFSIVIFTMSEEMSSNAFIVMLVAFGYFGKKTKTLCVVEKNKTNAI